LRYEQVHHELDNIFAEFSCKTDKCVYKKQRYLYVCGYLDNTIKIFDLEKKPGEHFVKELKKNNARVTCIKFSKDYKYLITCDADGVIQHYEKNCHMCDHQDVSGALNTTVGSQLQGKEKKDKNKKEHFPFTLLNTFQDQMSEIVAIDINDTLDMYVTLSRDGTIALRCLRTSKLWRQFRILYKLEQKENTDKTIQVRGFIKNFKYISALKLSLHGYIVVCGPSSRQQGVS
jgi:WD40 repeat protein